MSTRSFKFFAVAMFCLGVSGANAQSKSAIQFWDTTGASKTGRVGWTGDVSSGHFFIHTPNEEELIKSKTGGIDVNGSVTATKFNGDGSGLTNLSAPAVTVGAVTGLLDSLNKKAAETSVTGLQSRIDAKADSSWVIGKLGAKATTADVTTLQGQVGAKADTAWVSSKITSSGAGQIADGAVTTAKIADKAVTDAKIDSVGFGKIKGVPSYSLATHSHVLLDSINVKGTVIQKNGNVGIGTTSPLAMLHIKSTSGDVVLRLENADGVSGSRKWDIVNNSGGSLSLYDRNIGGADGHRLMIDKAGNVGIGTIVPYGKLAVSGSSGSFSSMLNGTDMIINLTGGSTDGALIFANGTTAKGYIYGNNSGTIEVNAGGTNQNVKIVPSGSGYTILNGNVGIGTTSPKGILDLTEEPITSADVGPKGLIIRKNNYNTLDQVGQISFCGRKTGDYPDAAIRSVTINGGDGTARLELCARFNNSGYHGEDKPWHPDLVVVSGYVGIGTTTPSERLSVSGNICASGSITGNSTSCPSDRRYKTSITPLDSSLSKVSKLQGVSYKWDRAKFPQKNFPEGKQVGLIAQDVEKVIPEIVNTDKDGYKSLSYDKLTALLIEAVKEQKGQIETQQTMIADLRKEVEGLKTALKK
jgi:hypothetical protein